MTEVGFAYPATNVNEAAGSIAVIVQVLSGELQYECGILYKFFNGETNSKL